MRDGLRIVLVFIGLGAGLFAAVTWIGFRPGQLTTAIWTTRFVAPLVAMAAFATLLRNYLRPDKAPDYLRKITGRPFECEGLCFCITPEAADGIGELHLFFQNRFERPCEATIRLHRMHGFAISKKNLQVVSIPVTCSGGGFGLTRVPLAIPAKLQGKKRWFEISASVKYPERRGTLLRYRAGRTVMSDRGRSSSAVLSMLLGPFGALLGAATGGGRLRLRYPRDVAETLPADAVAQT